MQDTPDLLLVDSGLPSDHFNKIGRCALLPRFGAARIEAAINHFRQKKRQPFYLDTRPLIGPRHLGSNVDRSRYGRQRPDLGHGSPVEGFKTFEKYGRGSRHHARNEQKKHNRFRNLGVNRVQTTECAPHRFLYRFQHRHCHAQRADEALCRLCWRQARRCRRNILSA